MVYDNMSSVSEDTLTAKTPESTAFGDGIWDGRVKAVPWPSNTYKIYEKGTSRAITLTEDKDLKLVDDCEPDVNNQWLCVDCDGYMGFYNPRTSKYLGHDNFKGRGRLRATQDDLHHWELFLPRHHPSGGYQLVMPKESHKLMVVTVADDGDHLWRTMHGTTVWEFVKV